VSFLGSCICIHGKPDEFLTDRQTNALNKYIHYTVDTTRPGRKWRTKEDQEKDLKKEYGQQVSGVVEER